MSLSAWRRKAPDFYWKLESERAAWLAGLVEGEGHIGQGRYRKDVNGVTYFYAYPRITLQMTDRDVVEQAHRWSGLGTLHGPYEFKTRPGAQPVWMWAVSRRDEVLTLIGAMWPYLGSRRRSQAKEAIQGWKEKAA